MRGWAEACFVPVCWRLGWSSGCCPAGGWRSCCRGFVCVCVGGGGELTVWAFGRRVGGCCGCWSFGFRFVVVGLWLLASVDGGLVRLGVWGAFRMGASCVVGGWCRHWLARLVWSVAAWSGRLVSWSGLVAGCPRYCEYPFLPVFFMHHAPKGGLWVYCCGGGWHRLGLRGDGEPLACRSSHRGGGTPVQCGVVPTRAGGEAPCEAHPGVTGAGRHRPDRRPAESKVEGWHRSDPCWVGWKVRGWHRLGSPSRGGPNVCSGCENLSVG